MSRDFFLTGKIPPKNFGKNRLYLESFVTKIFDAKKSTASRIFSEITLDILSSEFEKAPKKFLALKSEQQRSTKLTKMSVQSGVSRN